MNTLIFLVPTFAGLLNFQHFLSSPNGLSIILPVCDLDIISLCFPLHLSSTGTDHAAAFVCFKG
jgi:hypothetical protein